MTFKLNVLAGYVSQLYVAVSGIVFVPVYVKYMGVEAYGLVGFYAMLQVWFMLLDMGLTPTMARETARFRGGAIDSVSLRRLLRALEWIFIGIGSLGAAAMIGGSGFIASSWLKVQQLPLKQVQQALMLIALIVALRWTSELYRGVITGFERLVWLSALNIAIATFRFVLVIPFFIVVGSSPVQFFSYQLVLGVAEVALLVMKTYSLMPNIREGQSVSWSLQPLREVLHFSLAIAFISSVWVFVTQTDKLILSKLLPLSEYAYFTLAVLLASGVTILGIPISTALVPRMVRLNAAHDEEGMIRLYRNAAQMVAVIAIPTALVLALFSEKVLWAWTGNQEIAQLSARVLTLYALGNGMVALSAFPYYLQFAKGDLKLHLIGSLLYVLLLVPFLIWATIRFGMIGAGYAWLGSNAVYFFLWVPQVHRRFVKGLHKSWIQHDIAGIAVATGLCAAVARYSVRFPSDRLSVGVLVLSIGLLLVVVAGAASSCVRGMVSDRLRSLSRREML